jgi:hypothetical protein
LNEEASTCYDCHGFKMAEHKYFSNLTSFVYDLMPFLTCWIVIAPNQRKQHQGQL